MSDVFIISGFIIKYEVGRLQSLNLPRWATPVNFSAEQNDLVLYMQNDPRQPCIARWFMVIASNDNVPERSTYIGTAHLRTRALHLFEVVDFKKATFAATSSEPDKIDMNFGDRRWLPFNINHVVRVQLTESGRAIHREVSTINSAYKFRPIVEDAEGWSEWILWVLMRTFGDQCFNGQVDPPFKTEIQFGEGGTKYGR